MFKALEVLIVEDSPLVQKQVTVAFEDAGFNVIGHAQNGVEALMKCKKLQPDVISIDIIMPEMHGIDLFREIKKQYPNIKCLFITCLRADQINNVFPNEIEAFQFLEKPVDADLLTSAVHKLYETDAEESAAESPKESEELPAQGA